MKLSTILYVIEHLDILFLLSGCLRLLPFFVFIKLSFLLICRSSLCILDVYLLLHIYILQITSPILVSPTLCGQSSAGLCPSAAAAESADARREKQAVECQLTSPCFCLLLNLGPSSPHFFFFFASFLMPFFFHF